MDEIGDRGILWVWIRPGCWSRDNGMDSRDHVARRGAQARWARFLQEEGRLSCACMQIAGGWMECRGSAGAGEGQVHAGTLAALVSGCALGALSTE